MLSVDVLGVASEPVNSLLLVNFNSAKSNDLQYLFNRFLNDCSPNSFVELSVDELTENSIRKVVGEMTGEESYSGSYKVSIDGENIRIFFNR